MKKLWHRILAFLIKENAPIDPVIELTPAQMLAYEVGYTDGMNDRNCPPARPENRVAYEQGRQAGRFVAHPF